MLIKVGTYNLNNLFSRFNFAVEIDGLKEGENKLTLSVNFDDPASFKLRNHKGRLIKKKSPEKRAKVARCIMEMDLDVLAVQEVESREFLEQFNAEDLQNLYPFQVLIEGNDERLINVGLLSKLPLGAITSWRFAVHPDKPDERVFGRDLVQVEVLSSDRRQILFTVFNTHLKSHYIPFDVIDPLVRETLEQEAKAWRKRQAEVIAQLLRERLPQDCRYMVLGDFNDPPESDCLFPLLADPVLNLLNALTFAQETNQTKKDKFPLPDGVAWTVRHKASQQPPTYQLFDQIWLSPALAPFLKEAWIKRRKNLTGDGSDHDPVYVVLEGIY